MINTDDIWKELERELGTRELTQMVIPKRVFTNIINGVIKSAYEKGYDDASKEQDY